MNLLGKLARDSLWLLVARIGAQACMVLVTYLLARRLSLDGFGMHSFILAVVLIGNMFTTFGSDMVLIREIAAQDDLSLLPSAVSMQLVLSFLFIGFVYLFAPALPNQTQDGVSALRIYSLALIPLAFFTVFTSVLRGRQRMTSYSGLNFVIPLLQAIAISIFIEQGTSLVRLAYLLLGVQTLGSLVAGILCFSISPDLFVNMRFSLKGVRSLLILCLPVASISMVGILYQRMSLIVLSFLGTVSMTGLFSAAARSVEAARVGHIAVFTALYPALAGADRDNASRQTLNLAGLFLIVVAIGGAFLLSMLAKPLIVFFFGAAYQPSVPVLQVLAFSLIPYTINSFLSLSFLAQKRERVILRILAFSLLVQLALDIWLIPRLGAMGAGWAILVTETVQAVLLIVVWGRNSLRERELMYSQGVHNELSDLS